MAPRHRCPTVQPGHSRRHYRCAGRLVWHRRVPPKPVFVTDIETDPCGNRIAIWRALTACAPAGRFPSWPPTATSWVRRPCTTVSRGRPSRRWSSSCRAWPMWRLIAIERRKIDELTLALSERTEAIREDERTSIARELHDHLGQALTALKLDMSWLARRLDRDVAVMDKLEGMKQAADGIISRLSASRLGCAPASWISSASRRRSSGRAMSSRHRPGSPASCAPSSMISSWTKIWRPPCSASSRRR